jgi:hypothetical protein
MTPMTTWYTLDTLEAQTRLHADLSSGLSAEEEQRLVSRRSHIAERAQAVGALRSRDHALHEAAPGNRSAERGFEPATRR